MNHSVHRAHVAMRRLLRASWWIALLLLALLPVVAAVLPGMRWPEVAVMDVGVLVAVAVVLACSGQARAGMRMLPAMFRRPRPRRGGGLTAAHLSL